MKYQFVKPVYAALACLLAGACSAGGDWPDLSAPVEGYSESAPSAPDRIVAPPAPPSSSVTPAELPATDYERAKMVEAVSGRFGEAAALLAKQIAELEYARPDDRMTAWNGAQISLTRLSRIADDLNLLVNLDHAEALAADGRMTSELDRLKALLAAAKP